MVSDSSFSCKDLENLRSRDLRTQFKYQPKQKLKTLKEDLQKKEAVSTHLALKIIKLLCSEDILSDSCNKVINAKDNDQSDPATSIVDLISRFSFKKTDSDSNLALLALKKDKKYAPFVKVILRKLPIELQSDYVNQIKEGESLLTLAVEHNLEDLIKILIDYGAKTDIKNSEGNTPLSIAFNKKISEELIRSMIARGIDYSFKENKTENNYLHLAILNEYCQIFPLLVDKIDVNDKNCEGDTSIHLILKCPYAYERHVLSLMEKTKADPFICNNEGRSSLEYVIENGFMTILSEILEDRNLGDYQHNFSRAQLFKKAVEADQIEAVKLFLTKGFDPDVECRCLALPLAVKWNDERLAESLIKKQEVAVRINNASEGKKILKSMLDNKLDSFALWYLKTFISIKEHCDPNIFTEYLEMCCQYAKFNLIRYLLDNGPRFSEEVAIRALKSLTNNSNSQLTPVYIHLLSIFETADGQHTSLYRLLLDKTILKTASGKETDFPTDFLNGILKELPNTYDKKALVTDLIHMYFNSSGIFKEVLGLYSSSLNLDELLKSVIWPDCVDYGPLAKIMMAMGVSQINGLHISIENKKECLTRKFLSHFYKSGNILMADSFGKLSFRTSSLFWFFNTFLTDSNLEGLIDLNYIKSVFRKLLGKHYNNELEIDQKFFENAQKRFDPTDIINEHIKNILQNIDKTANIDSRITQLINLRKLWKLNDKDLDDELIKLFILCAKNRQLSLCHARELEKIYPEERLNLKLSTGEIVEVNRFIIFAGIPLLNNLIEFRRNDKISQKREEDETLQVEIPSIFFNIIYPYFKDGIWNCGDIEENSDEMENLQDFLTTYEITPPAHFKKYQDTANAIKDFLQSPYQNNTKELTLDRSVQSISLEDMITYLKNHPHIEKIKLDSSLLRDDILKWDTILPLLRNLKEVHVTVADEAFVIPEQLKSILFFLTGTKKLSQKTIENVITYGIGDIDLPGEQLIPLLSAGRLNYLRFLNLSNTALNKDQLQKILNDLTNLTQLSLENCTGIIDDDLLSIDWKNLTEINLEKTAITPEGLINFIQKNPQIEIIRFSSLSDKHLQKAFENSQNPRLNIIVNNKTVLRLCDLPSNPDLRALCDCVQDNFYLLDEVINSILNNIFVSLDNKNKLLPPQLSSVMIKLLELFKSKNSNAPHSLITYKSVNFVKFYLSLMQQLNGHTLDEFLKKKDVKVIYERFRKLAEQGKRKLTLPEARDLSKLFGASEAPLITFAIKRDSSEPKESTLKYNFHPLILLSASKELRKLAQKSSHKSYSWNSFVLHYMHAYLENGQVDLKKISSNGLFSICKTIQKLGLRLRPFLNSAEDGIIKVKFKPDLDPEFLKQTQILKEITIIDLEKSDCSADFIQALMPKLENLKGVRLLAKGMTEELWKEFNRPIEISLIFKDFQEISEFKFPNSIDQCRIKLELDDKIKFETLSEYLSFLSQFPCVSNIDVSSFTLDSKGDDFQFLIDSCTLLNPQTLNLGNCVKLKEEDFEKIAQACQSGDNGLKTLTCAYYNRKLLKAKFREFPLLRLEIDKITDPVQNELCKLDLSEVIQHMSINDVIQNCTTLNPMVLDLGNKIFTREEIERIVAVCPRVISLKCAKHSFDVLKIFKKDNPNVEYYA